MSIDVGFKTQYPFEELEVTKGDLLLGSIVFGFFFGFAVNVTWCAILETRRARRFSGYIIMIWVEILADLGFCIVSWGYLAKIFPPGLGVFLTVILCWICQVQCLMLIHRQSTLHPILAAKAKAHPQGFCGDHRDYDIHIHGLHMDSRASSNQHYLNHWYDRFEKSVYLLLDLFLNLLFIHKVKTRLVQHGLKKYDRVMRFNQYIIVISIGMDVLLLGVTALRNQFVYCQFHPVVYIVKLQIEMSMSRLLIKVARSTGINVYHEERGEMTSESVSGSKPTGAGVGIQITTQIYTHAEHPDEYEMEHRKVQEATSTHSSNGEVIKISTV
ncbi:hypothetical protein EV421DRAFT_1898366 [Armillaria borealis]|uniref:Integral membrane protein n=1 Tax=Armillaria borealis TaxID=47425 RepID=A0AA39N067_9AGAR|nr:hypothetical protein EV421DRAFT_1898366 [Armillaria borealis]